MQTIKATRTIAQSTELHQLKKAAKSSAEIVTQSVKQSRLHAECALAEALICGATLNRARQILGTEFNSWLPENLPSIHHDHARAFMVLAESQARDETLQTRQGMRDALASIGVI